MEDKVVTLEDILSKRKNIKAFLFDLDGTLINSKEGIIETLTNFLNFKGNNIQKDQIRRLFGTPIEVIFRKMVPGIDEEEVWNYVKEVREVYAKNHLKITETFPESKILLQALQEKGYRLGVASTKLKKFVVEALEHFELLPYIEEVVSGYEVENHKPAPDILLEITKRMKVSPSESIYIGDAPSDIIAGKEAGTVTIAVLTGSHSAKKFVDVQPDFVVSSLKSLKIE